MEFAKFIINFKSDDLDEKTLTSIRKSLKKALPGHNPVVGTAANSSVEVHQFGSSLVLVIKDDDNSLNSDFNKNLEENLQESLPTHKVAVIGIGVEENLQITQIQGI